MQVLSERRCIVSGQVCEPDRLIRFVREPDSGQVVPDLARSLPGRGVWVTNAQSCIADAVKRKLFARAFRDVCQVDPDLASTVGRLLEQAAMRILSLARKAGQALNGFEKVDGAIQGGGVRVLLGASNGSLDGRNKLKQRLRAYECTATVIEIFDSEQLSLALGRTNVIHAALTHGGLADKFLSAAQRVHDFRELNDDAARRIEEKA